MARATKSKAPTTTPRVKTTRADGRPKSALAIAGDQAKLDAERETLRAALVACGWVAVEAGRHPSVQILDGATLSRQVDRLGLRDEYERNRPK